MSENISKEALFEWIRANQSNRRLSQPQVDATDNLLITTSPKFLQDQLSSIAGWPVTVIAGVTDRPYDLTIDSLNRVYAQINAAAIPIILKYAPEYGIVTKKQMAAFIATCIIESNGFNAKRESFAYSAKRLTEVFPKFRIPSLAFAQNLVNKGQVAIANHLYGDRYGNRAGTNDGWDYRGGGLIQNTFRSNYYELQQMTGIAFGDNPKLIEDLDNSVRAAMAFWQVKGCNDMAEKINVYSNGYTLNTLDSKGNETKNYDLNYGARLVRKTVNGGFNGYKEFCHTLEQCLKYL